VLPPDVDTAHGLSLTLEDLTRGPSRYPVALAIRAAFLRSDLPWGSSPLRCSQRGESTSRWASLAVPKLRSLPPPRRGVPIPLRSAFAVFNDLDGVRLPAPCGVFQPLTPMGFGSPSPRSRTARPEGRPVRVRGAGYHPEGSRSVRPTRPPKCPSVPCHRAAHKDGPAPAPLYVRRDLRMPPARVPSEDGPPTFARRRHRPVARPVAPAAPPRWNRRDPLTSTPSQGVPLPCVPIPARVLPRPWTGPARDGLLRPRCKHRVRPDPLRARTPMLSHRRPFATAGFLPLIPPHRSPPKRARSGLLSRPAGYEDSLQLEKERVNLRATNYDARFQPSTTDPQPPKRTQKPPVSTPKYAPNFLSKRSIPPRSRDGKNLRSTHGNVRKTHSRIFHPNPTDPFLIFEAMNRGQRQGNERTFGSPPNRPPNGD